MLEDVPKLNFNSIVGLYLGLYTTLMTACASLLLTSSTGCGSFPNTVSYLHAPRITFAILYLSFFIANETESPGAIGRPCLWRLRHPLYNSIKRLFDLPNPEVLSIEHLEVGLILFLNKGTIVAIDLVADRHWKTGLQIL